MDSDFLLAKVHGLRSMLYEGDALRRLLQTGSLVQLAGTLFPGESFGDHYGLQRRLAVRYSGLIWQIVRLTGGRKRRVFEWLAMRTLLENLKVLVRCRSLPGDPLAETARFLTPCPFTPHIELRDAMDARDTAALAVKIPSDALSAGLMRFEREFRESENPFYLEVGLDQAYYQELRDRTGCLHAHNRERVALLVRREIVMYDLLAALRARTVHDMPADEVRPLLVEMPPLTGDVLDKLSSIGTLADLGDCLPGELSDYATPGAGTIDLLERHIWCRSHRLAARQFVACGQNIGCVTAYCMLRRIELINLIRVVEGVRLNMDRNRLAAELLQLEPAAALVS